MQRNVYGIALARDINVTFTTVGFQVSTGISLTSPALS